MPKAEKKHYMEKKTRRLCRIKLANNEKNQLIEFLRKFRTFPSLTMMLSTLELSFFLATDMQEKNEIHIFSFYKTDRVLNNAAIDIIF
jgi:Holliday junction resolvase